jgi:hypothetical protein
VIEILADALSVAFGISLYVLVRELVDAIARAAGEGE